MADLKRERYGLTDADWAVAVILHEGCWCEPEQELYAEEGQTYGGCGPWLRGEQARRVVAAVNGPEPTWVDLAKAARAAGWERRRLAPGWVVWVNKGRSMSVDFRRRSLGQGVRTTVSGPDAETWMNDPTPAKIMTALGLVGLGGDSDER